MIDHAMSDAVRAAYRRGEEEETMQPLVRVDDSGEPIGRIRDGDYVLFYNIRGEREIELARVLTEPQFSEFPVTGATVKLTTMIQYDPAIPAAVAFPPQKAVADTLSEVVSKAGLRQQKIAESEKGVHIRYFLNGKNDTPFPGEEWNIVESSREVEDFDELPEMNAADVAERTINAMREGLCHLVVTNFANMDVVGHIEDATAVQQAIETVDAQVGRVIRAAAEYGYTAVVTADHGTVEKWYYPDGSVDTGHTDSRVPCIVTGDGAALRPQGALTDVAPTVLELLGVPQPAAMTGTSLLTKHPKVPAKEPRRVLLLIVDGWGLADNDALSLLARADTPNLDALTADYPCAALEAFGEAVGMPAGTVGNSEAGHLHIGAGRVIPSDRLRIERAMADGSYLDNPAFTAAMEGAKKDGKALHLLGIISFYSSHGSVRYLLSLLEACRKHGMGEVYVHGLLGRRGERPETGAAYIGDVEEKCAELGVGMVVSAIGRHWALDREERWERVQKAYDMLFRGTGTPVYGAGSRQG